jgi:hypothetical protein
MLAVAVDHVFVVNGPVAGRLSALAGQLVGAVLRMRRVAGVRLALIRLPGVQLACTVAGFHDVLL